MKAFLVLTSMIVSLNVFAAKYEVPVTPELKQYASFDLPDLEKTITGDHIVIEYSLPKILTGECAEIKLSGKIQVNNNVVFLYGEQGTAKCTNVYSVANCTVVYTDIEIDEAKAIKEIKKISKSEDETLGRIEVMRAFSTDPVGIITY